MSGFDKFVLMEKLKKLGWKEAGGDDDPYGMIPPDELWKDRPHRFYVYDARDLQNILGQAIPEDET
jgi:hypothetical protein